MPNQDKTKRNKEYERARMNMPHRAAYRKKYQNGKGHAICLKSRADWEARNRIKVNAKAFIYRQLKKGGITKPDACENCKEKKKLQGHHYDYAKPLEVRWLCQPCHRKWHRLHGEGANAT